MTILILGPTGVVGDAMVREALADRRIDRVVAISRRPLKHTHDRLQTVVHDNFADFEPLAPVLARVDVVLCALGVSWYQVKGETQYRLITHDYVLASARTVSVASPAVRFCFVSGGGASPTSSQAWARIKAETEKDLEATFGARLTVLRPGYIYPVDGRDTRYWGDAVMRPFMPFRGLLSKYITDSREVARAALYVAMGGTVKSPAENRAIIAAAAAYAASRVN